MIPDSLPDWIFELLKTGLVGFIGFFVAGGFKRKKAETENVIISAIKEGATWIAANNKDLQNYIDKLVLDHKKEVDEIQQENKRSIDQLEEKFKLKTKEYTATIENLEIEKRILEKAYATKCLEYDNLLIEHDKLKNQSGATVRKING